MERLAVAIGQVLRQARLDRGLTLKDVARRSGNRFRPTSIAGYERAERSITVERFCDLARLYDVPPERLLTQAMRLREGRSPTAIDLTRVQGLPDPEGRLVAGFVDELLSLRGEPPSASLVIRHSDLEILASTTGDRPAQLLEKIRAALRHAPPDAGRED
jgi:transcriptional regulator with XRE-family HTH domain